MIKLHLQKPSADLHMIQQLPGMQGLKLDPSFGLILLNPKTHLYAVRAETIDQLEARKQLSPEIIEAYGDIRISTT